jgi:hypothetical protein
MRTPSLRTEENPMQSHRSIPLRWLALATVAATGLVLSSVAAANPPLANPSFEIVGPAGSPTFHSPAAPGGAGQSAADGWGVFHNSAPGATTLTQIVPTTLPGGLFRMIHVDADAPLNGINQVTGPPGTGAPDCIASAWVYAVSGTVGMGSGNHGLTSALDATTSATGSWEYLQAPNGFSPCNAMIFYAIGGAAEFYVDEAELRELQQPFLWPDVEYSNRFDERSVAGGGGHGPLDPGQVLYTHPPDTPIDPNPSDAVDFFPLLENENEPDAQVDAIANSGDALFESVVAEGSPLLISLEGDPGVTAPVAAYYERLDGSTGVEYTQRDLHALDIFGELEDVDGLDLHRDHDTPLLYDADAFSLLGDVTGVSVYSYVTGAPVPFVTRAQLYAAIVPLGFQGEDVDVDLDALMVKDVNPVGVWDMGDAILFSVRANGGFDGGEVIHWEWGMPAAFLVPAGHKWDTAFPVANTFGIEDGTEEVDALEALLVPEPAAMPLLVSGILVLRSLHGRRSRREDDRGPAVRRARHT